jgi:rRNA maturation protein Rpf1
MNRGKSSLISLAERTLEYDAEKTIIVDRWKGGVGKLQLFEIGENGLTQHYPIIYVKATKLRRDFPNARRRTATALTLQTTPNLPLRAKKLADALSGFLNIHKAASADVFPQDARTMRISINDADRIQINFLQPPETEIGPRIIISHLVWNHEQ